eukprot:7260-Eustigmatos_ZCMA.PRE.1
MFFRRTATSTHSDVTHGHGSGRALLGPARPLAPATQAKIPRLLPAPFNRVARFRTMRKLVLDDSSRKNQERTQRQYEASCATAGVLAWPPSADSV